MLDLIAAMPARGEGLHKWLFRVARVLHPYRTADEIIQLLRAATAGEPLKKGEIESAVERSKSVAWKAGQKRTATIQPAWPKIDTQKRQEIIATGENLTDLWEASPVRIEDDDSHTEKIIDVLFPGNPLLCCGARDDLFETRSREEWRGNLSRLALIVPSPMTARIGLTQNGKESAHALSITGPRRFLIIEQDSRTIDEQAAILLHLAQFGPLALAVHSGSKSIHGWFACRDESEQTFRDFMQYAVRLGADSQLWTRSQFARMPDGRRADGQLQAVHYFNPEVLM